MGRLFGTDGVRGLANRQVTTELAMSLGRAITTVMIEEGREQPSILVGRDPRWSGEMLEAALAAGITSAGGNAILLGVLPTPGVAFLTVEMGAAAGAMISASHNAVEDNGIKFFGPDGFKLTDLEEDRLEQLLVTDTGPHPIGTAVGRIMRDHTAISRYVDHLVAAGPDLKGLKVVVDGANGAASEVAPLVYRRLGAEVIELHCEPDGANINDGVGSTHPDSMARMTAEVGADFGVAHDGDADRLICAAADGTLVDGDVILAILAKDRHDRGVLAKGQVVTTVMTNLGFKHAMQAAGIAIVQTAVGDRYVLEEMRHSGATLGGEQSGHVIQLEAGTTGDGVLSAVALLDVIARTGTPLSDLAAIMTRLPQVLVNVKGVDKARLADCRPVWEVIEAEESTLADTGRVLVRSSGTEPLIRVMVEAASADAAQASADRIADVVRAELSLS